MGFLRDDLVAAAGRGARLCAERAAGERYALSWRLQSVCVSEGRRLFRADIVDAAANALIRRVASRVASHARHFSDLHGHEALLSPSTSQNAKLVQSCCPHGRVFVARELPPALPRRGPPPILTYERGRRMNFTKWVLRQDASHPFAEHKVKLSIHREHAIPNPSSTAGHSPCGAA